MAARQRRPAHGPGAAAGRHDRLGRRRLAVHLPEAHRPDRFRHRRDLRRHAVGHRPADAVRKHAHLSEAPAQSRGAARQAAYPLPGASPAVQAALLQVQALYQRPAADRPRLRDRHPVGHPGRRRRLRAGAGHDLPARHADHRGDRHLELPDPVRGGQRHLPAGRDQRHGRRRAGAAADPGRRGRRADRLAHRRPPAGRGAARPDGGAGAGRRGRAADRAPAHAQPRPIRWPAARCCREAPARACCWSPLRDGRALAAQGAAGRAAGQPARPDPRRRPSPACRRRCRPRR